MASAVNVAEFVQHRQIGKAGKRKQKHVESFLEAKGLTSLINKECSLSGHCRSTFNMEFSPDGTKVASTHGDHTVRVTDIATGKCVHTLTGHPRTPWCLAYHPSSSHILASGCLDGQVRIWDLYGQGCEVWQTESSTPIASMTFHPVDHVLVFASGKTIYFWDWGRPEPFAQCTTKLEYERIRWVKFDPLGHILYTGISNNTATQRDDASRVSLMSQRGETQSHSQRPDRFSSLYNNLLNRYQEHRRDQVVNQVQSQLRQESVRLTSSWDPVTDAEMNPGVPDSDIVRPLSPERVQRLTEARQYAAEATERSRERVRQHAAEARRSLQRARLYAAEVSQMAAAVASNSESNRSASRNDQSGNADTVEPSVPNVLLEDHNTTGPVQNQEEANEIRLDDIEISFSGERDNLDTDSFVTENYDMELNNMLGIEESVSNQNANDSEGNGLDDQEAGLNDPLVLESSSGTASVSKDTRAGLSEQVTNTHSAVIAHGDNSETTSAENSAENRTEEPVVSQRGIWSPPPRHLSSEELNGETVGQREEDINQGQDPVSQDLVSVENMSNQANKVQKHREDHNCNIVNLRERSGDNVSHNNENRTLANTRECLNCTSRQEATSSRSTESRLKSLCDSRLNNQPFSGTPMLARYLQSQKTVQNSSSTGENKTPAVFPNIRERLQTNIPLSSCDGTPRSSIVRVLSSRGEIPTVTVVSACERMTSSSSLSQLSRPMVASGTETGTIFASSLCSTSGSAVCRPVSNSATAIRNELDCVNYPPIVPTVIASTSSHASLFQNIYNNSRGTYNYISRGGFGGGQVRSSTLSNSRNQPYLQNRSRFLSLMGPYLESRGVGLNRTNDNNTEHSTSISQSVSSLLGQTATDFYRTPHSESHLRVSSHGLPLAVFNATTAQSNTHESSDTESELNTHLHNRAYFLPISEDQTRTISSTSVQSTSSIDSTDNLVVRQRSVSRESLDGTLQSQMSATDIPSSRNSAYEDFVQDRHQFNRNTVLEGTGQRLQDNFQNFPENIVFNQDDNNNTICVSNSVRDSSQTRQGPEPYIALRDNLVTMTDQIEQEMNELNRRISALRDSFNQSLQALRHDRERYQNLGRSLIDTGTNLTPAVRSVRGDNSRDATNVPEIRVTRLGDVQNSSTLRSSVGPEEVTPQDGTLPGSGILSQPPTLLETSLRSHNRRRQASHSVTNPAEDGVESIEPQHWRMLQRHYLHPHYSSSILDETINRPNNAIQNAINRAIAGAFTSESAVVNNIINQTHRIQYWDFTKLDIPDITHANHNIVVPHCKLHNDASCDISQNGSLLATFVPSHHGFPDDNILAVYSLEPSSRGQCLYTKSFGPNAVSVSISPRNNFVMVGLAAKRLSWAFITNQIVAQIYKFEKENAGEKSMKHITDVIHPCDIDLRTHISGNAAKWLPTPGHGLVYGTNRGHLRLCRPFCMVGVDKKVSENEDSLTLASGSRPMSRRNLLQMLGLSNSTLPRTISISTQTNIRGIRQNSGTQTDNSDSD